MGLEHKLPLLYFKCWGRGPDLDVGWSTPSYPEVICLLFQNTANSIHKFYKNSNKSFPIFLVSNICQYRYYCRQLEVDERWILLEIRELYIIVEIFLKKMNLHIFRERNIRFQSWKTFKLLKSWDCNYSKV